MSSDRFVIAAPNSPASSSSISPEPAYIAASAASIIITSEHRSRSSHRINNGQFSTSDDTVTISPASLKLLNTFLDQLLYNVLASARSTSVASLRSAVNEVLKPRLAKEAIIGADEELQELLGGGDEVELSVFHNGHDPTGTWDLQSVWRRTRLRCMVYTRLGDLEEDEEEAHIGREPREETGSERRLVSRDLGIVSPAAAIFLTSIIEFVGEHALAVAGEAASNKLQARFARGDTLNVFNPKEATNLMVEETDMEKIALNPTLGRLWRSWKKQLRSPSSLDSKRSSRDSALRRAALSTNSQSSSRNNSSGDVNSSVASDVYRESSTTEVVDPSSIPLPISDFDIAEIEVPGYLSDVNSRLWTSKGFIEHDRPYSMASVILPTQSKGVPAGISQPSDAKYGDYRPVSTLRRHRSISLPPPIAARYMHSDKAVPPDSVPPPKMQEPMRDSNSARSSTVLRSPDEMNLTHSVARAGSAEDTAVAATGTLGTLISATNTADVVAIRSVQNTERPELSESTRKSLDRPTSDIGLPIQGAKVQNSFTESSSRVASSNFSSDFEERHSSISPNGIQRSSTATENTNGNPALGEISSNERASVPISKYSPQAARAGKGLDDPMDTIQGGRSNQYTTIANGRSRFVLDAPPAPRGSRSSSTSDTTLSGKDLQPDGTLLSYPKSGVNVSGTETGVPTLTPLQELMDAAHDTSDEAPSTNPSRNGPQPEAPVLPKDVNGLQSAKVAATPSSRALHGRNPSLGTKPSDLRKPQSALNTSVERSVSQQVSPSLVSASEQGALRSRRSASTGRDGNAVPASGSFVFAGSQKPRSPTPWPQRENPRTSSDGSGSMSGKKSLDTQRSNDRQRSFEQLIRSDETLQYTLTPQNMREMEAPDSPRWAASNRHEATKYEEIMRRTASSFDESARTENEKSPASIKGLNGLRSNPVGSSKPVVRSTDGMKTSGVVKAPATVPTRPSSSRSQLARDPRVKEEATTDFADFIRSTGPEHELNAAGTQSSTGSISASRPTTAVKVPSRKTSMTESPDARKIQKSPIPRTAVGANSVDPISKISTDGRLEPRDARIAKADQSSDLVDFFRQGPPLDYHDGGHEKSGSIAPFRITMGPDEMRESNHGRSRGANTPSSMASTQRDSLQSKSMRSSTNSRTGLLESPNRIPTKAASTTPPQRPTRLDEPTRPFRTQRRVKEKYAIDSDTEDDSLSARPKPVRNEEGLLDFLQDAKPPVAAKTQAPSSTNAKLTRMGTITVHSNNSGPSMQKVPEASDPPSKRAKFSTSKSPEQTTAAVLPPTRPPSRGRGEATQAPAVKPRAISPHLSKIGGKWDSYRPTAPTYAAHIDRERNGLRAAPTRTPRAPQPRPERDEDSNINDLADFLKNSGPPVPIKPAEASPRKEEKGFIRMFSRRKKNISSS